jgi:hypothetical protein
MLPFVRRSLLTQLLSVYLLFVVVVLQRLVMQASSSLNLCMIAAAQWSASSSSASRSLNSVSPCRRLSWLSRVRAEHS